MKPTDKARRRQGKKNPATFSALWTPAQLAAARKKWGRPEGKTRELLAAILNHTKHPER